MKTQNERAPTLPSTEVRSDSLCIVAFAGSLGVWPVGEGRKSDRPSESTKKEKERARLWRLLHVEHRLRCHACRPRCYPKAAPDDRTFSSCKTMQVRHVARISSRNIREKPNLDLLNNGTAKWTARTLQRYSIPPLPRFDFFFHVLTFPVPGLNFVHFFRCFLFMKQFLLRQNFAPTPRGRRID